MYKHQKVEHTYNKILWQIGWDVKKIYEHEKESLEVPISMSELNDSLLKTRNNVSPGVSGFSGCFYKVFWKWLKHIVLGSLQEIFKN